MAHAAEIGAGIPDRPMVFTEFPSCLTGPQSTVTGPAGGQLDWEAERVTVQRSRTSDLIFPVPELVSWLSHELTLYPATSSSPVRRPVLPSDARTTRGCGPPQRSGPG